MKLDAQNSGTCGVGSPVPLALDDPSASAYDSDGVDRSLVRESLSRTPAERLDIADSYAQEIEMLRLLLRPIPLGA
ncbi:MAG: hypothetical protein ABIQ65_05395 [Thermoanaerobaculia bacterium]